VKKFSLTLLGKLIDESPQFSNESLHPRLTLEQLKEDVARDLEYLLNTRCALEVNELTSYKEASTSLLAFGIQDFVERSLASDRDRKFISQSIEKIISAQERRLRSIKVEFRDDKSAINRLHFGIRALLVVRPSAEPVNFDAVLFPLNQRYSVKQAIRQSNES
jgi:type VI secretion system protein ImpF